MPTLVNLVFDDPAAVFFSGQTVSGHIEVSCDKPKSCRGVYIEFYGFSKVHWTERRRVGSGKKKRTVTKHFRGHEEYYKRKYLVWGDGAHEGELPPGTHLFNFNFLIPHNVPSSFESNIGKVRHQCKAIVDMPWKVDKTCLRPFSVNTLYDLNTDSQAQLRIECNKQDYMCCLWCRSGPLSLVLRIDRSGFVPGENMMINAEISNMTRVDINYSKAEINQCITYYASGSQKQEHRKVAELKRPEITAGGDDTWSGVEFKIPAVPPSFHQFCRIIDIAYEFKFEVEPSGCHSDLKYKVPIIIGSIPLRQHFNMYANTGYPGQPSTAMAGYTGQPSHAMAGPSAVYTGQPNPMIPGQTPDNTQYGPQMPGQTPVTGQYGPQMYQPPTAFENPNPTQPSAIGFVGQPTSPGYHPQPAFNPDMPEKSDTNTSSIPPPAYPGPQPPAYSGPQPSFPGSAKYPEMPLPSYNACMFGATTYNEDGSDDDEQNNSGMKFTPSYVTYNLSK